MDILSVVISFFIVVEFINVMILYFKPGTQLANGVGVFNAWEASKKDPQLHEFVKYLVYWVAGTKLIFVVLLGVILFTGSVLTKLLSVFGLILSIVTFYWRLYPIIRNLDETGHISPKGYSKGLRMMISGFIVMFGVAMIIYFFIGGIKN